jgi:3-hydroxy-9,10-secoandrosta-1,3,5(10)-triene-9,17-dione monooxygenase
MPSRDELVRRAELLAPALRSRSAAAEAARCCPPETIGEFVRDGLLRICQPARYGGYELGWDVLCEVSQALARGCGAQAWVQNIFSDHCQKVAMFPVAAQDDIWVANPDARISASLDPVGTGHAVAGGVRYSGRHAFASGIDYADWLLCGGHHHDAGGHSERSFFLVPKSEAVVIDDWFVVGLSGTGSKSFEIADAFVPEHRILRDSDADGGTGPGNLVNTAPVFKMPRGGITSTGFAAVAVGIAEGFFEEYVRYTRPRKSRGVALAELMGTEIAVGTASAEISSAALIYLAAAREAMAILEDGGHIGQELRLRAKRDSGFAAQLCLAAVTRLFNAAGGRALSSNNPMQRQFRDLLAAASHHSLVWDTVTSEYGRLTLKENP